MLVLFPLILVVILLIVTNIRIVPQSQAYVIGHRLMAGFKSSRTSHRLVSLLIGLWLVPTGPSGET